MVLIIFIPHFLLPHGHCFHHLTKVSLELSVEQLGAACSELREQVAASTASSDHQVEVERQSRVLQETLTTREQSYSELQTKLAQVGGDQ